jgi:hypothetical protein
MMDAFFGQAKKMVMETVGLQDSVAPDAEFEKWHEHVKRLEGMAVVLRRQFNAYATSMTEMVRDREALFEFLHSWLIFVFFGHRCPASVDFQSLVLIHPERTICFQLPMRVPPARRAGACVGLAHRRGRQLLR